VKVFVDIDAVYEVVQLLMEEIKKKEMLT